MRGVRALSIIGSLLLVAVVLGVLSQYSDNHSSNMAQSAHVPTASSNGWIGDSLWTYLHTVLNPFYVLTAWLVEIALCVAYGLKRATKASVGLLLVAIFVYFFHPPIECDSRDRVCIQAQQKAATEKARKGAEEIAEAERKRQHALEMQRIRAMTPSPGLVGELGTTIFGNQLSSANPKCDGRTAWPFRYELYFKEVPENATCGVTFKMKDNRTYEVRYRDGHTTIIHDGPDKTVTIDLFAKEVRAIGDAFDAYTVLYPPQTRF